MERRLPGAALLVPAAALLGGLLLLPAAPRWLPLHATSGVVDDCVSPAFVLVGVPLVLCAVGAVAHIGRAANEWNRFRQILTVAVVVITPLHLLFVVGNWNACANWA